MRITEQGQVQNLALMNGTGDDRLDRWVVQSLERYQFHPALIDGHPVAMDHEETVRILSR
jgi:outer membrane biosynthesis protein TonB